MQIGDDVSLNGSAPEREIEGAGNPRHAQVLRFGPFRLAKMERLLLKDDKPVVIGSRALDVLFALTAHAGKVVSRRDLIDLVWPDVFVEEANLRVHVTALRKALGDGDNGVRYIVNVPGRGYSFVAPIQRVDTPEGQAPAAGPARRRNLPALPRVLVGRDESIEAVSALLLSNHFVSLVGPGGIGKTTVAVAVAHALRDEFGDDAICFVDLSSLSEQADVSSAIASALGCLVQGPDPTHFILSFLGDRRMLLVLDNCEHVVEAVALLSSRLRRGAPALHLLATSREVLRAEGENVYLLAPLETGPEDISTAPQALATPAIQLFMDRAASSGYRASLSDLEAPIVAAICRRLDGIALAIELVASRVSTYSIAGIEVLLNQGAQLLLPGTRSSLPRHQTLQAMLDWSFNLLPAHEQALLARLSVFAGQFSLDAALDVARQADGDSLTVANAFTGLLDKSLVSVSGEDGAHYKLLETTRVYAATKLADGGEADLVARRHALYFTGLLQVIDSERTFIRWRDAAVYAPHLGNIRKALTWCFSDVGDHSIGVDLAIRAAPLFLGLFLFTECERWCWRAIKAARCTHEGAERELALQMPLAISSMFKHGNRLEVKAAIERGLEISDTLQDGRYRFDLLSGLHTFFTRRGEFESALAVAKRLVAVAEDSGDMIEKAVAQWALGTAFHCAGDQATARHHCRLGFQLIPSTLPIEAGYFGADQRLIGLAALARSSWLSGWQDQGAELARQAIRAAGESDHALTYCVVVIHCIYVFLWNGDVEMASGLVEAVMERAERYSFAPYQAVAMAQKGELLAMSGDAKSAVELLGKALESMLREEHHIVRSPTFCAMAQTLCRLGRPQEARDMIDDAVKRAEERAEVLWLPDLFRRRGEVMQALPQPDLPGAEVSFLRSIEHAKSQSALSWELKAAIPLARIWKQNGREKDARLLLAEPFARFTEGFGSRDLVAARELLDELK